jgi:hypothetical protein
MKVNHLVLAEDPEETVKEIQQRLVLPAVLHIRAVQVEVVVVRLEIIILDLVVELVDQ